MFRVFYCLVFLLLGSCEFFTNSQKKDDLVVARVMNTYLYASEVSRYIPEGIEEGDSLVLAKGYINTWAKNQLMLYNSEMNLSEEALDFDRLVEAYRSSLFINAYKEGLVNQYLDTVVLDSEISAYYQDNKVNFKVNEDLMQLDFIELSQNLLNKEEIEGLFKSKDSLDLELLNQEKLSFTSFDLHSDKWVSYSSFLSRVPIFKTIPKDQLLKKNQFFEKQDSISLYLLAVKNVKRRSEIAPLDYIRPTVKRIIIQQRKLELIRSIEQTLIDDAIKKKEFELY